MMQELVGRLSALDPEASETLKVIAYFDALIEGHASSEVLLRGAAILGGCAAGYRVAGADMRVDVDGRRSSAVTDDTGWPRHSLGEDGVVWLEREGAEHANDHMILERLALAIAINLDRRSPHAASRRAIETLIDPAASAEQRGQAMERLALRPLGTYRVVAAPRSVPLTTPNVIVSTPFGSVRAAIIESGVKVESERIGIGVASAPEALAMSWRSALVALRLSSERLPTVRADDLGAVLLLAESADAGAPEPADLAALSALVEEQPRALPLLESLIALESARAVAADHGLHHSTVQARIAELSRVLGYDLRQPSGRLRLALALSLHRLAVTRFE